MARILIIDDDVLTRQLIASKLGHEYEVLTAPDGTEGLELARSNLPDLIVCDLIMPDMDGFEVLRRIQSVETMADVPFIFLSGATDSRIIRQGMALGADDFLTKPFAIEDLSRIIKIRLEKRAHRQALIIKAIDELRLTITRSLPHELRTAIMIVEGYANIVLEDAEKIDPAQREMIEKIRVGAKRLHQMAEKYLWYLKTHTIDWHETGQLTRQPDAVITRVAREVAEHYSRSADLRLSVDAGEIAVSEENLAKIVEETVENAFKFSEPDSEVTVSSANEGNEYVVVVNDHGRGLTQEQIRRIGGFMQFERAQYEQKGTGLGLIIAKRLAERSGGRLTIVSGVTGGEHNTKVFVFLPRRVTNPESRSPSLRNT